MRDSFGSRLRSAARAAALASLPLLAVACDDGTSPREREPLPLPSNALAALRCEATVATRAVSCAPLSDDGAQGGESRAMQIVGGQGLYVRMTSTSVTYAAEVFSFNATVQNLTNQAMGTADGTTPHADGVRVFFHSGPTVTGGNGTIGVANATGTDAFTGTNQPYFEYAGAELGGDGILGSTETSSAKNWQINVQSTVTSFSFVVYVAAETPAAGPLTTVAPQVTSISPATLVPGSTATLTGINFNATAASNTVTIGGRTATVTGGNATQLTVTVPCVSSGSKAVAVTTGGMRGADFNHPLQVAQQSVGIGQAVVLTSAAASYCNELPATNAASRYIVAVFNASTSPSNNSPSQFSADMPGAEPAVSASQAPVSANVVAGRQHLSLDQHMDAARQEVADRRHAELLEMNRRENDRLRAHFRNVGNSPDRLRKAGLNRNVIAGDPPLTRTFRVANINGSFCNSFYVVSATRVYYNGKVAIYEDDATPDAFKSSLNASMAANYQNIGDQFNTDMEPVLRDNFGDVLLRDDVTDNNDVLVALFTPRINTSFSGVAGFVVSCDQYPNDDTSTPAVGGPYTGTGTNGSSNFGEFFYAYQPVTNATGYSGNTPQNWFRTIRSTFIHESKHVVSMATRAANAAPLESGWLEEGTARHSEELWIRNAVDNIAWKGNYGYGSAADPKNIYCDVRPEGFPECLTNPRRPANGLNRHFGSLYTQMFGTNARLLSPFGATASDNASYYYAISWSLVRYAIDRYGASDAAFLTALTNSNTSGVTNLTARAGVSIDQLLGGWALSLAADDHPLLAGPANPDIQFPTWNMRSIFAGYNADFSAQGSFTAVYPQTPAQFSFGSFNTATITTLRGGGVLWYEISGTQTAPQLLRLENNGGTFPSSNLRLAVTRIQ